MCASPANHVRNRTLLVDRTEQCLANVYDWLTVTQSAGAFAKWSQPAIEVAFFPSSRLSLNKIWRIFKILGAPILFANLIEDEKKAQHDLARACA